MPSLLIDYLYRREGDVNPDGSGTVWSENLMDWVVPGLEKMKVDKVPQAEKIVNVCNSCQFYGNGYCRKDGRKINTENIVFRLIDEQYCPGEFW